jgi:hypothetical protein
MYMNGLTNAIIQASPLVACPFPAGSEGSNPTRPWTCPWMIRSQRRVARSSCARRRHTPSKVCGSRARITRRAGLAAPQRGLETGSGVSEPPGRPEPRGGRRRTPSRDPLWGVASRFRCQNCNKYRRNMNVLLNHPELDEDIGQAYRSFSPEAQA